MTTSPTTPPPQIITGKARLAGVMGWPVEHSRSPALHNYWLRRYGVDGAYV
ncbi:MAG: shikimate dehydrogenase, partial [Acetobacter fabarum]|nr:shikimate dehydrogenase [Acetobacter fabarum]